MVERPTFPRILIRAILARDHRTMQNLIARWISPAALWWELFATLGERSPKLFYKMRLGPERMFLKQNVCYSLQLHTARSIFYSSYMF